MSVTIELTAETEARVRELATFAGLAMPDYVRRIVESETHTRPAPAGLSKEEIGLIEKIYLSRVAAATRQRYQALREKMLAETLTETERPEFLKLADQLEAANAERLAYLVALAQFRQVSLQEVMLQLGLKPPPAE